MALASAAVILIAAATWLAIRPGPAPQGVTTRTRRPDMTLPMSPRTETPGEQPGAAANAPPAPVGPEQAATQRASAGLGTRTLPETTPLDAVADEAGEQSVSGIPRLIVPPIEQPAPVVIPPVVVNPIGIPEIQIPPVEDWIGKTSEPPATGSDKKQPGGASSAPTE